MEKKQETWIQPRLIVLGRGTPEENVLAGCKTNKTISGPSNKKSRCYTQKSGTTCKTNCNTISATS
jgi:hypothetical protein